MRSTVTFARGATALALLAACAASGNDAEITPAPDADGSVTAKPDGGLSEVDAGDEVSLEAPACSEAGWCVTALPDTDLLMKDIWPMFGRAFAVAESPTLGIRVLEWTDAEAKWRYIDDSTQNESGFGRYVGKIWGPNENEIYYGVSPGYIYHGTRDSGAATGWSWTRHRLANSSTSNDPDDGNPSYWRRDNVHLPALGVWGTGSGDLYAWFKNTIYHCRSSSGTSEWVAEYVAADADTASEELFFLGATAMAPDDIWFSGARSRTTAGCAVVVRRTSAGYRRVADGIVSDTCTAREGFLKIGGAEGWLTDIHALSPHELVGLKGARDVVKISIEGDNYSVAVAPVPETVSRRGLNSLSTVSGDLWLAGVGLVVRGTNVWEGGAFELSTIWRRSIPSNRAIYKVQGISSTDLWAIGVGYAFHKTTR